MASPESFPLGSSCGLGRSGYGVAWPEVAEVPDLPLRSPAPPLPPLPAAVP